MKSIVDFINEKQNFLIKGHTKDQKLNGKYGIYKYVGGGEEHCYVALVSEQDFIDFNKFDNRDETYDIDELKRKKEWVSVWPGEHNVQSINMDFKYLTDEFYQKVASIDNLNNITIDYWKTHNLTLPR